MVIKCEHSWTTKQSCFISLLSLSLCSNSNLNTKSWFFSSWYPDAQFPPLFPGLKLKVSNLFVVSLHWFFVHWFSLKGFLQSFDYLIHHRNLRGGWVVSRASIRVTMRRWIQLRNPRLRNNHSRQFLIACLDYLQVFWLFNHLFSTVTRSLKIWSLLGLTWFGLVITTW